jgi:ABC-type Fe3+-hydroxamate transport system substrate-binding protein
MQLHAPQRIVSLVPSLTELLYALGLEEEVKGITRFCVHPAAWKQQKAIIGGTKQVHVNQVQALQPDLVIASKEENVKEQIEAIAAFAPVWVTDIGNLEQALEAIEQLGQLCHRQQQARQLINAVMGGFAGIPAPDTPIAAAYLIWQNPYMTVGGDTFIHDMMQRCGLQNAFGNTRRYPVVTLEELAQSDCKVVLLSSEPFPFGEKHVAALQQQLPRKLIYLVDGEMFSWYGSRLVHSAAYFINLGKALPARLG